MSQASSSSSSATTTTTTTPAKAKKLPKGATHHYIQALNQLNFAVCKFSSTHCKKLQ